MAKLIQPPTTLRLWRVLPAVALAAAAALSAPAQATNPNGCQGPGTNTTYYSDAALTNQVGYYSESCAGVCTGSGRVTQYSVVLNTGCAPIDPEL
jgi:Family of unknown function (DUF6289)